MSSMDLLGAALSAIGVLGVSQLAGTSKSGHSVGSARKQKRANSSGLGGMNPTNRSDLRIRPPTTSNVPSTIPRNIPGMLAWDTVKIQSQVNSGGSGLVEANFIFTITLHPQYSQWLALFDQYCIVQATVEFDSLTPPGQTYSSPQLYTAIDFDNAANLGSIAAFGDFGSSESVVMAPEKRHMRSVKPCFKATLQTSGASAHNAGVGRGWIDSAANDIQHYGIRSIGQFAGAGSYNVVQTIYFAFRNQI